MSNTKYTVVKSCRITLQHNKESSKRPSNVFNWKTTNYSVTTYTHTHTTRMSQPQKQFFYGINVLEHESNEEEELLRGFLRNNLKFPWEDEESISTKSFLFRQSAQISSRPSRRAPSNIQNLKPRHNVVRLSNYHDQEFLLYKYSPKLRVSMSFL